MDLVVHTVCLNEEAMQQHFLKDEQCDYTVVCDVQEFPTIP
jgi:hypothetical protein